MGARRLKSKTLSGTNSPNEQPEPVTFFIDECLGKSVVAALEKAGVQVRYCYGYIAVGAKDSDWLKRVGKDGFVVLTKDKKIRRRVAERNALIAANVKAFVLTSGGLRGDEIADIFASNIRKIEAFANATTPPFIASITRSGEIHLALKPD